MVHSVAVPIGQGRGGVDQLRMFRAVVEASRDAVVIMTPDGQVLYTNPAHDALFGRAVAGWRGDYRDLWAPASQLAIESELAAALNGGDFWEGVLEAQDAAGRRFPLWHRAGVARDEDGQVVFYFSYMHDHSAQRRAEDEARRAREDAEKANQAKTRFLAAASHDLRQPLQALAMFVAVLSNREHSPANRKVIDRIEDSLAATDALLSSLLDISKLEAGMVLPAIETVSIDRILTRMRDEFTPLAHQAGLALRVVPCGATLRTDGGLLERILRNLLANAVRYTEQGGILLGCRRRGDILRIEVWDTGPGIPRDQFELIFREFHQLGNSSRDRRQGLGLGLAIVERLAKLLGHPVTVLSTLHKGSVFAVEVPLAGAVAAPQPEQLDLGIAARRGGLIAVVDDEPDVVDALRMVLESWGYQVVTAGHPEDAIDQLVRRKQVPDLMIADYRLHNGITGGQAIARLRLRLNAEVPAIILTGDTAPERLRMANANGHGLLHKPVQPAQLRRAIDEALTQPPRKARRR